MNFFDHKNLGNHLLQLCPKVVKHSVYRTGPWKHVSLILVQNFILPLLHTALTKCSDEYRIIRGIIRVYYIERKWHLLPTRCVNIFIYVRSQNKAEGSPVAGLHHAKFRHFLTYHTCLEELRLITFTAYLGPTFGVTEQHTVQTRRSRVTDADTTFTNIRVTNKGVNFQSKTPVWSQKLMKYQ